MEGTPADLKSEMVLAVNARTTEKAKERIIAPNP